MRIRKAIMGLAHGDLATAPTRSNCFCTRKSRPTPGNTLQRFECSTHMLYSTLPALP